MAPPSADDTFRCRECNEDVPVEDGQADGEPDLCSDCWAGVDPERARQADALCRALGALTRERRSAPPSQVRDEHVRHFGAIASDMSPQTGARLGAAVGGMDRGVRA